MIFLLTALGIVFLFIGILVFAFLFINNNTSGFSGRNSHIYENFVREDVLFNPFFSKRKKGNSENISKKTDDNDELLERETYFIRENLQKELEKKKQIESTSTSYIITMSFSLFLYLIAGLLVVWYFNEYGYKIEWQKHIFLVFYIIGFILFIISILTGSSIHRLGEYPALHLMSKHFPFWQELSREKTLEAMSEEYKIIASTNIGKERNLQTAKYLFIFSYGNLLILALILLTHYFS